MLKRDDIVSISLSIEDVVVIKKALEDVKLTPVEIRELGISTRLRERFNEITPMTVHNLHEYN